MRVECGTRLHSPDEARAAAASPGQQTALQENYLAPFTEESSAKWQEQHELWDTLEPTSVTGGVQGHVKGQEYCSAGGRERPRRPRP